MVFGDDRPAIFFGAVFDVFAARVDHRLNRESHADFEFFQRAGFAVVQHLGLFVEHLANAVPTKLAHHAEALAFSKFLNGPANVA